MTINEQLESILSSNETTVYLYLLQNGLSTPPQISKGTGISRTNCYHLFQSLKEKQLIEIQTIGKRKAYMASDPSSVLRELDRKRSSMEQLLPDLRALYVTQKNKPKIHFYDGADQILEVYDQSLGAKEIFAIGSTEWLKKLHPSYFTNYGEQMKKRGIIMHDIVTHQSSFASAQLLKEQMKGLYSLKSFPKEFDDVATDILVWDDNVALITTQEPIFATVLVSPLLAQSFKMLHQVLSARL